MTPPSFSRVAVVTGANKGIGLAVVRQLALAYPSSSLNKGPLLIYLTARDQSRGEAAVKDIHNDLQLSKARALDSYGGLSTVKFHELDIANPNSIDAFAASMKETHPDGIDFLINNAGMAMNGFDLNVVKTTLGCNYYGTLAVTEKMLPQIRDGGRLVNVASMLGHLGRNYSDSIRKRFLGAKSVEDVNKLMEDFTEAVAKNEYKSQGWPGAAYAVSKSGTIAFTKVIAREQKAKGSNVLINVCCPVSPPAARKRNISSDPLRDRRSPQVALSFFP
jgi:carbonyl reductase 1